MLKPKWLLWTIPVLMVLMAASADAYVLLEQQDYTWAAFDPDTGDPMGSVNILEKYKYIDDTSSPFFGYYYYLYTIDNSTLGAGIDIYDFHVQNQGPGGTSWVSNVSHPPLWTGLNNPGVIDWDTDSPPQWDTDTPPNYTSAGAVPTGWALNSFDVVVKPEAHPYHGTVRGWVTDVNGKTIAAGDVSGVTPEPGTLLLLGFGLAGMAVYGWRRKKKEES